MSQGLSVCADEFVPNFSTTRKPLTSTLSADVPEFIPKCTLNENSEKTTSTPQRGRFSRRNDHGWYFNQKELSPFEAYGCTETRNMDLRKSDSYHFDNRRKDHDESVPKGSRTNRKLVNSYSLEVSRQKESNTASPLYHSDVKGTTPSESSKKPAMSWSSIVKTPAPKPLEQPSKQKLKNSSSSSNQPKRQFGTQKNVKNNDTKLYSTINKNAVNSADRSSGNWRTERKIEEETKKTYIPGYTTKIINATPGKENNTCLESSVANSKKQVTPEKSNLGKVSDSINSKADMANTNNRANALVEKKSITKNIKKSTSHSLKEKLETRNNNIKSSNMEKSIKEEEGKFTKKKLTRTYKQVISSFDNVEVTGSMEVKHNVELGQFKTASTDVRELVSSLKKSIEHGSDSYRITKTKHRLQNNSSGDKNLPNSNTTKTKSSAQSQINTVAGDSSFPALVNSGDLQSKPVMSYSAVLKKVPLKKPVPASSIKNENCDDKEQALSKEEKIALKKKLKSEKRKLKIKQKKEELKKEREAAEINPPTQTVKQSQKELTLDISSLFDKLFNTPGDKKQGDRKKKQKTAKKMVVSTGVISVVSGLAKKNTPDGRRLTRNKYGGTSLTVLDGGTPIRKRGKEREIPKRKKPTLLKKIIKAERERRKLLLAKENKKVQEEETAKTVCSREEQNDGKDEKEISEMQAKNAAATLTELPEEVYKKLHSRKFREYCNHMLTKDINGLTCQLLVTLQRFQDRVYHESPNKYKQKRRFVLGLREVLKHLKVRKLKAVIIAPNLERISTEGGLDDYLGSILSLCNESNVPQIYAMNRHVLGRTIKKQAPVSIIGVFNYDGAQDIFKELMNHVDKARLDYDEKVSEIISEKAKESRDVQDIKLSVPLPTNVNLVETTRTKEAHVTDKTDAELVKQQILSKFSVEEFRLQRTEPEEDHLITEGLV